MKPVFSFWLPWAASVAAAVAPPWLRFLPDGPAVVSASSTEQHQGSPADLSRAWHPDMPVALGCVLICGS